VSGSFDPSSRSRLTARDLGRFPAGTLFDRIARAVCRAECLPRKELYEAWEVARRARRRFRGGRVVDLGCGHALLAHLMLILDDSSPDAVAADLRIPDSAAAVSRALIAEWPRLAGRVAITRAAIADVPLASSDLAMSVHGCGALSDQVIERAIAARARIALLPCCHDASVSDPGALEGWMDPALAIDATRVARLRAAGFEVRAQRIPGAITPKNRLILASPRPT
jgi:hypothetical protein